MKNKYNVKLNKLIGYAPTAADPPYISGMPYIEVVSFYRSFSSALKGEPPLSREVIGVVIPRGKSTRIK